MLPFARQFLDGDETPASNSLLNWMNLYAIPSDTRHVIDQDDFEMAETCSKLHSFSPEKSIVGKLKKSMASVSKLFLSSDRNESEGH